MEIRFFYKPGCPYCRRAEKLIGELVRENPQFAGVSLERIDETKERALADQYDYWYVPSFFAGEQKLYEASPIESEAVMKTKLEQVFRKALAQ